MPVRLFGEGEYNLDVLKEIRVTESFLTLEQNVIKCQNEESEDNCRTRHHVNIVKKECSCLPLPYKLRFSNEEIPVCSSNQMKCVHNLKPDYIDCLPSCRGLMVTSFSESRLKRDVEDLLTSADISAYKKYINRPTILPPGLKG